MWIPSLLEGVNETEMQMLGSKNEESNNYGGIEQHHTNNQVTNNPTQNYIQETPKVRQQDIPF